MSEVGGAHTERAYDQQSENLTNVKPAMKAPQASSGTMKAVRFHGKHDLRYEDIANPTCGKGQIKIKPAWCGICGSGKFISWFQSQSLC